MRYSVAAFLVRDQICRRTDDLASVDYCSVAGPDAAKIEQVGRDRLAAKRFAFDQAEILCQIVGRFGHRRTRLRRSAVRATSAHAAIVASGLFISWTTPAASRPTAASFSARLIALHRFDSHRNVFADGDDVRYIIAVLVFHRDLTDHPVPRRTVIGDRLLFDPLNASGAKSSLKFLSDAALRIFFENVKNVTPDSHITRNSQYTDLAMTVPGDDPVIAIDNVERNRQCIEYRLGKFAMFLDEPR